MAWGGRLYVLLLASALLECSHYGGVEAAGEFHPATPFQGKGGWSWGPQGRASAVLGTCLRERGGWNILKTFRTLRNSDVERVDPPPKRSVTTVAQAIRQSEVAQVPDGLGNVLTSIGNAVEVISEMLRKGVGSPEEVGTTNDFGDEQLQVDLMADDECFKQLKECGAVCTASSEETNQEVHCDGRGYAVAFDPLDGSSIIDANWAVGSIFGIYPDPNRRGFKGRRGRDQCAGVMAVYGPKTSMAIGLRLASDERGKSYVSVAFEVSLTEEGWAVTRRRLVLGDAGKRVFSPGNLRAGQERAGYAMLLNYWLANKYTLRYTGGMVPDVYYALIAGFGVFCNPSSPSHRAKLRLLYECAPIAMIVECAGGMSTDGKAPSLLDVPISSTNDVTDICVGSPSEVKRYRALINAPTRFSLNVAAKSGGKGGCLPFWPFS